MRMFSARFTVDPNRRPIHLRPWLHGHWSSACSRGPGKVMPWPPGAWRVYRARPRRALRNNVLKMLHLRRFCSTLACTMPHTSDSIRTPPDPSSTTGGSTRGPQNAARASCPRRRAAGCTEAHTPRHAPHSHTPQRSRGTAPRRPVKSSSHGRGAPQGYRRHHRWSLTREFDLDAAAEAD